MPDGVSALTSAIRPYLPLKKVRKMPNSSLFRRDKSDIIRGFLIRNDYTTILNHKPLFLNASRPSKILRSYTPTFLSNFITIATLTQICNTRLRIRKNANIKKNKKILNKSIGQMSFRKEKILFLILLFYFFRFLVRQEK